MSLALLIGDRHGGKTSACLRLAEAARAAGLSVSGIIAPAVYQAGRCVGYDVVDLATGGGARLASLTGPGVQRSGRFHFLPDGLELGRIALERAIRQAPRLVIVDEVGPLELGGGGWSRELDRLVRRPGLTVLVVRRELAAQVAERWSTPRPSVHDLAAGADGVVAALLDLARGHGH